MSDAPKNKKVFLALPTYSNLMRKDFVLALMESLIWGAIPGVEFSLGTVGGDGVARARNNLTQAFLLTTDCDYIVYIDVDIVFSKEQLAKLISHLSPERPIVGGLYAAKQLSHRWIMTGMMNEPVDPLTGLQRVKEVGTGFKGYHRSYFERVRDAFPEIAYTCDGAKQANMTKWDFFSMGVVNGRYLSEDYYADYRAERIGMPVYVDTTLMVKHQGEFQYPLLSDMRISDKVDMATVFKIAQTMGATGHTVPSEEEVRIAMRLHKIDVEEVA